MEFKGYKCSQCGAKNFEEEDADKLRCVYCESLFFIEKASEDFGVTIVKGAKIVFKPTADVTILGKLDIEEGADVQFDGKIKLIKRGSEDKIKKNKLRLKD
jgi:DNA-directed RNA polymerase subunit RPC12/RpoP